ncbi:hypothetical protein FA15DRAFT_662155 [Coprinopsis marcescibilis]|uniref:Uncharacterized protein n=1 Tax=Coprinopsis marcescibilis TaxID=230819 RepID=A0A5C3K944_COPMA|nr:hypothetical protein FA15DRAFT_662155 [Coprinopsis marcescibilis]
MDFSDDDHSTDRDYKEDLANILAKFERDEYELLPTLGYAGPQIQVHHEGRHLTRVISCTLLDDEDTHFVEDTFPQAGKVLRCRPTPSPDSEGDIIMEGSNDWAIKETVGQSAFDQFFKIPGLVECLGLSFNNMRQLHKIVDLQPDKAGEWETSHLQFDDDPKTTFTIRHRNVLKSIESIFKNPNTKHLVYKPSKIFSNDTKDNCIYSEMWKAKWWHIVQSQLPPHATIAPVIIATNKTQLTQFSSRKAAYPVYLTIGNVPKSLRRKPSTNASMNWTKLSDEQHQSKIQCIFHESMAYILGLLKEAGRKGIKMENYWGEIRQIHPILSYVADYPEQCLVACCKYGTCPKYHTTANELADPKPVPLCTPQWTWSTIQQSKKNSNGSAREFQRLCMEEDVTGSVYHPFWLDFPLTDIHHSLTPDVLHQLYQGIHKHVINWCQEIVSKKKLDLCIHALPQFQGLRQFKNGISALSQISEPKRKDMAKILLPCLVGKIPSSGLKAVKGLLDFIFLSQYPTHDSHTLKYLEDVLDLFQKNKSYFIDVNCHKTLNILKFHSLIHYAESIQCFGTTDNYNTEIFECLHIEFAKEGWHATNQGDKFPQMIQWLS